MVTQDQIIALHRGNPALTARQIGDALGCNAKDVHNVAYRNGLKLPKGKSGRKPLAVGGETAAERAARAVVAAAQRSEIETRVVAALEAAALTARERGSPTRPTYRDRPEWWCRMPAAMRDLADVMIRTGKWSIPE